MTPQPKIKIADILQGDHETALRSILEFLDPICIEKRMDKVHDNSLYGAMLHSDLCRLKMLGFSNNSCAKAIGVKGDTLRKWMNQYPQLTLDMERAEHLSKAEVAKQLFKFMGENSIVGLNAVKFFLGTRTDEFREKTDLNVAVSGQTEVRLAIRDVYGFTREIESEELPCPGVLDSTEASEPAMLPAPSDIDQEL